MDFFDRLESAREHWNVLEHSFYRRWTAGELSGEELARYAGEYRHAVVALASNLAAAARGAEPAARARLERHAAEEAAHVDLWEDFVRAVGGDLSRPPRSETTACVQAWRGGTGVLERLAVAYAIESGQPEISRVKLEGLVRHYGIEEGPATAYFELHAELDREHAAESRALIEQWADATEGDRMVGVAEGALRGNWILLDGVNARRAPAA